MILFALILAPVLFAVAIAFAPSHLAKTLAGANAGVSAGLAALAAFTFNWGDAGSFDFVETLPFIGALNINLSVGVDSIAMWLILLTAFLQPLMVLGSTSAIKEREPLYYGWLTALQGALFAVFAARDLIVFYAGFEFTLLPLYILINQFGSSGRRAAATKFFLFTFTGSIVALAGLVYVAWKASSGVDGWTFELGALMEAGRAMSGAEQAWVLLALMLGFAVKVPLFPVHTWLPQAHTEAPTAGSVILAGVLLKLGTYAMFRLVLGLVPDAVIEYAATIGVLAVIGILYGGLICWAQRDVKKLVAYSSVAHLGFCVLGLFALNIAGLQGSVLYMVNHGLSTGALFFCIGMMYERYHTRSMDEVSGLGPIMPVWSFFFVFFTMASVGLPGLNGFVSEFLCLMGAFQSGASDLGAGGTVGTLGPWFAAIAATGMIVAAIYLLYMVGKMVFGPTREPAGHEHHGPLPRDLSLREIVVLTPIAIACVVLGVYPKLMLDTTQAPIEQLVQDLEARPALADQRAGGDPVVMVMPETVANEEAAH